MKLDRNMTPDGDGKYALLNKRRLRELRGADGVLPQEVAKAFNTLKDAGVIDDSVSGTKGEFFVMRLRDAHSRPALVAYAEDAATRDPEYAADIMDMANRAGVLSPWCKYPD